MLARSMKAYKKFRRLRRKQRIAQQEENPEAPAMGVATPSPRDLSTPGAAVSDNNLTPRPPSSSQAPSSPRRSDEDPGKVDEALFLLPARPPA